MKTDSTRRKPREREYLTPDEVQKLLMAAKEGATRNPERDHCILTLLYHQGVRVSELCDLRVSDINVTGEPTIYVRHQKGGGASAHPLFKPDVVALRKWLVVRETMAPDEDYLFVSERRTRINRRRSG
jgi:type 1 fimbriae regulatory protein FimB